MDARGYSQATPRPPAVTGETEPFLNLLSGYVLRLVDKFPRQGATARGACQQPPPRPRAYPPRRPRGGHGVRDARGGDGAAGTARRLTVTRLRASPRPRLRGRGAAAARRGCPRGATARPARRRAASPRAVGGTRPRAGRAPGRSRHERDADIAGDEADDRLDQLPATSPRLPVSPPATRTGSSRRPA